MKLNLIYHLTAVDRPLLWYNLSRLNARLPLFNGQRIISIALPGYDEATEMLLNYQTYDEAVKSIREGSQLAHQIKRVLGENDRTTYLIRDNQMDCGLSTIGDAIHRLTSDDPNEFTFYGHSKGIRYQPHMREYQAVALWVDALYTHTLDPVGDVIQAFQSGYDAVGAIKCVARSFDGNLYDTGRYPWSYAGAFGWYRHSTTYGPSSRIDPMTRIEDFLPSRIDEKNAFSLMSLPRQFTNAAQLMSVGAWEMYLNAHGSNVHTAIDRMNDKVTDIQLPAIST